MSIGVEIWRISMGSWERKHDCFLYFVHNQNMKLQSFRKDSIQVIVTSFDVFTSTTCRDLISSSQATLSVDHPPQLLYHYWVPFCKFQPHFIGKTHKNQKEMANNLNHFTGCFANSTSLTPPSFEQDGKWFQPLVVHDGCLFLLEHPPKQSIHSD